MVNPRYMQIPEGKIVGDKTIIDEIIEIVNMQGKFAIVKDSLVITIIENPKKEGSG